MFRANSFNLLHRGRRLFQQWCVDMYAKLLQWKLNHARSHQSELRADLYRGLEDQLDAGDTNITFTGKKVILPATYSYTPRWYDQKYRDAMAIVAKYVKPDLFITFTCNARWKEITDELLPGQTAADRPELCARIFHAKLGLLMEDLTKKHVLGRVTAWMHTIEFQKRGLPHAHILLILDHESRLRDPAEFDEIVSAELPDEKKEPHLHNLVLRFMVHTPCNQGYSAPCRKHGGHCKAHFPKEFINYTMSQEDGYPSYRRRSKEYGGHTGEKYIRGRGKIMIDNSWIVSFSPYLLQKYEAHINVEVCCSIQAIKYLYKYIYKGHDKVSYSFRNRNKRNDQNQEQPITKSRDEIKRYFDALYISGSEACWKMLGCEMHSRCPSVEICKIHLPGRHLVYYKPTSNLEEIMGRDGTAKTMLTEWFVNNQKEIENPLPEKALLKDLQGNPHPTGPELLYHEYPEHYSWSTDKKCWNRRTKNDRSIGRMHRLSPKAGEIYFLRLLLLNVRGATSWDDLLIVDGHTCSTFKESAANRGLMKDDLEWNRCMRDAATMKTGYQLLFLFVTILTNCDVSKPLELWNTHKEAMGSDIRYHLTKDLSLEKAAKITDEYVENLTLLRIKELLQIKKKTMDEFSLPEPEEQEFEPYNAEIEMELDYDVNECKQKVVDNVESMNDEQEKFYEAVMDSIYKSSGAKMFFVDALGGTGKTFVAETILAAVRSNGHIAIAVAFSGILIILQN